MPEKPPSAKHILVVEDSVTQAERLRLILEDKGLEVVVAENGKDALYAMAAFCVKYTR